LVDALEVNDLSYDNAIRVLQNRFERKRLIAETHVQSLLEIPKINGSTSKDLRELLTMFTRHIEALRSLKRPVEHWDDILIELMKSKIDLRTLEQWDLSIKVSDEITFKQLCNFVESRASSLESYERQACINISNKKSSLQKKQTLLTAQNNRSPCIICSQGHRLDYCPRFKAMKLQERYDIVKNNKLCFNCLFRSHSVRDCRLVPCRHCKKRQRIFHSMMYCYADRSYNQIYLI
jgi:hypothetical protein